MQLLTNDTISQLYDELEEFNREFIDMYTGISTVVASFEKNDVVRSLYESGRFGQEEKEKLEKLKKGLKKYYDMISEKDGLVINTKQFLEEQRRLNNMNMEGDL